MAVKNIGKIVNTFGIRGQLKVSISTTNPELRFAVGKKVLILDQDEKEQEYEISSFRMKDNRIAVIGLVGYDDINEIEWMIGRTIRENVRPPKGEYFYDELVGMEIVDCRGETYGKVETVNKMPAGDYLVSGKSYIPFKEGLFVLRVDKKEKKIYLTELGSEVLAK